MSSSRAGSSSQSRPRSRKIKAASRVSSARRLSAAETSANSDAASASGSSVRPLGQASLVLSALPRRESSIRSRRPRAVARRFVGGARCARVRHIHPVWDRRRQTSPAQIRARLARAVEPRPNQRVPAVRAASLHELHGRARRRGFPRRGRHTRRANLAGRRDRGAPGLRAGHECRPIVLPAAGAFRR